MNNCEFIASLLIKLNLVFKDTSLDEPTIKMYISSFSGIEQDSIAKACKQYLKTGKKFPLPADIIELC
jgi:hypothetical protein